MTFGAIIKKCLDFVKFILQKHKEDEEWNDEGELAIINRGNAEDVDAFLKI